MTIGNLCIYFCPVQLLFESVRFYLIIIKYIFNHALGKFTKNLKSVWRNKLYRIIGNDYSILYYTQLITFIISSKTIMLRPWSLNEVSLLFWTLIEFRHINFKHFLIQRSRNLSFVFEIKLTKFIFFYILVTYLRNLIYIQIHQNRSSYPLNKYYFGLQVKWLISDLRVIDKQWKTSIIDSKITKFY